MSEPTESQTPETDEFISCAIRTDHNWRLLARYLERERNQFRRWNEEGKINGARCAEERDRLQDAVRNLRDVKGRHNSRIAYERLLALLPETVKCPETPAQ